MITIVLLALFAIELGAVFIDQRKAFDKITDFEARMVDSLTNIKKGLENRIDRYIETHNATVDHYDQQIDEIIQKMEKITEDIKRLDTELKYQQTKMNVVYPWFENSEYNSKSAGVPWAKDYPDQEVDHVDD